MAVDLIKSQFCEFDTNGRGIIAREDLVSVFTTLHPAFKAEDIQSLITPFTEGKQGNVDFKAFIEVLFEADAAPAAPQCVAQILINVQGFRKPAEMSVDERCEVERVVSEALMACSGEFEGEYFPTAGSGGYTAMPGGGISQETEQALKTAGMYFKRADDIGCGVFATLNKDIAVWINGEAHIQIFVKSGVEAEKRLSFMQFVVEDALKQDGYFPE